MPTDSLQGKKVLVPRGKKHAKTFSKIVEQFGGIPIEIPLLAFQPIQNREVFKPIYDQLHTYDWLIFTSDVTVETFLADWKEEDSHKLPKIAAIGSKTQEAVEQRGIPVHFKPQEYVAESFVKEFFPYVKKGEKLLLPKGNLAREYIATSFREKEIEIDEVIIYETFFPQESKDQLIHILKERELEILPFTSPSGIEHFMTVVKEYGLEDCIETCIIACIGPISKLKCESVGLPVHVMPEEYTSYEMIRAVAAYLTEAESKIKM